MLTTAFSVLAALSLLVPGFVVVELAEVRSARSSRSDLELALRAIAYALAIHIIFGFWTASLAEKIDDAAGIADHLGAVSIYAIVVLLAVPAAVGIGLNRFLGQAELGDGPPGVIAAALGAGEARDAFDYAFQRRRKEGAWVIIELVGHTAADPRLVGGIFGRRSAIGQTPSAHDVYLESLCTVAEDAHGIRRLENQLEPERGVYLSAATIARIEILPDTPADPPVDAGTIEA